MLPPTTHNTPSPTIITQYNAKYMRTMVSSCVATIFFFFGSHALCHSNTTHTYNIWLEAGANSAKARARKVVTIYITRRLAFNSPHHIIVRLRRGAVRGKGLPNGLFRNMCRILYSVFCIVGHRILVGK